MTDVRIIDLRAEQIPRKGDHRLRMGKPVVRRPADVTSLCVHQTACIFGPLAKPEVRYRRALDIASHATAFRTGVGVLQTPVLWYVNGGGPINRSAIHLEGEGHYAGAPDEPSTPQREDIRSTWGGKPTPLDEPALATLCVTAATLVELARGEGCPIEWVYAHRQFEASRRSDPGHEMWRDFVLGFCVGRLGLKTRPDYTLGDGRAIPASWGEGTAKY